MQMLHAVLYCAHIQNHKENTMNKLEALKKFLQKQDEEFQNLTQIDDNLFEHGRESYLVLTDKEADQKVREYIEENIWSFNMSFLMDYVGDPFKFLSGKELIEVMNGLQSCQERLCESFNPVARALVGNNFDSLVEDAISSDGRGHFLSPYDGVEYEEGEYFIYMQ